MSQVGDLAFAHSPQTGLPTGASIGTVTEAWGYNGFGEPTTYRVDRAGVALYEMGLQRDGLGRIVNKTETDQAGSTSRTYSYDDAGRLAKCRAMERRRPIATTETGTACRQPEPRARRRGPTTTRTAS